MANRSWITVHRSLFQNSRIPPRKSFFGSLIGWTGNAFARISRLELKQQQSGKFSKSNASKRRPAFERAATRLSDAQLQEAEGVFARLAGLPNTLSFYVDFALTNFRTPEKQRLLAEAVAAYVAAKEFEFKQEQISASHMDRIRDDLKRLVEYFPGKTVAGLTVATLIAFLEVGQPAMKTYNNRRGIVSTFLKFAFQRGWIAENPVPKIPQFRIRRKRGHAKTFTPAQARALMEHMETIDDGRWVSYFALCLFAGVRPGVPRGEIARLTPESVDLKNGLIHISTAVSKVREPRKTCSSSTMRSINSERGQSRIKR